MEVEVREAGPRDSTALLVNNASTNPGTEGPVVIVRAEEVLLVVLVLTLWVAAIALFFNRWGKIRMLEPYQPKFQQSHRPSCPLAPLSPTGITPQQRMSFSKYNVSCLNDTLYSGLPSPNPGKRLRQNSVFVGSSTMAFMNPPRRTKSAFDIQHLVLNEASPSSVSSCNSLLPMITSFRDRKPSITVERANYVGRRKPSMATDRPLLAQHHYARNRRPSCCADRISLFGRQRNFTSFDQPTISLDRKTSISVEKSNCIVHQPTTVSFEKPSESIERPFFVVDPPSTSQEYPPTCIAEAQITPIPFRKISLSFEQPSNVQQEKPPRMATSLDINAITLDRRSSIAESDRTSSDRASPISIILDETKITAPLIESLKSSDV